MRVVSLLLIIYDFTSLLMFCSEKGMDHNNLEEDDFIDRFSAQDLANHRSKGRPYKIIKDEIFGR